MERNGENAARHGGMFKLKFVKERATPNEWAAVEGRPREFHRTRRGGPSRVCGFGCKQTLAGGDPFRTGENGCDNVA